MQTAKVSWARAQAADRSDDLQRFAVDDVDVAVVDRARRTVE
jgi:hypothetical protein